MDRPVTYVTVEPGSCAPLGASVDEGGVNFSVFSKHATRVELLLFDAADAPGPTRVIPLEVPRHRTCHYWHVSVPGIAPGQVYGYRVHGPFAPSATRRTWSTSASAAPT